MIDPITALIIAAGAVSNIKTLMAAGQDASQHLAKFAGAWSDIQKAEESAKNPPWYKSFGSSLEKEAAEAFAAKKKGQELKKELESMIQFVHGPTGLKEYKDILRDMREQKKKHEFRKQQIKQSIVEWTVGILALVTGLAIVGFVLYLIGKNEGKW